MKARKNKLSPEEQAEERKKTITAFLLMFPGLIVGFMAIAATAHPIWFNVTIVALLILQFILLEQFVKDYYKLANI